MRKFQLLIALTIFSTQVSAEWELLDSNDEMSFYIDQSTIRDQGTHTAMWAMVDYNAEKKSDAGAYWSSKYLLLFNCRDRTTGMKMVVNYEEQMGLGKVLFSDSLESYQVDFNDVIPGSLGEAQLEAACGKK